MTDSQLQLLTDLRERIDVLERRQAHRGRTNQAGAARYLGISEETLRQRHARGEGPRRVRSGARGWSYTYDDLDKYAESTSAAA
jgi:hypothetical protein